MTQKKIKLFKKEIYTKPPTYKRNISPTKLMFVILMTLGLRIYCIQKRNRRGYRYVLVVLDNFSKFGWTDGLKNKNVETIKSCLENIPINSMETKPI